MLEARIDEKSFPIAGRAGGCVLRNVTLSAAPGEIVALLGASGTGKSTTLRILLGLDRAFRGEVRRAPGRIAAMFQEPRLLPWRTVAENLRLVVVPGVPPPDVAALLREVGLGEAGDLYPRQLSLGMARRAALARALAVSPSLLVLDEPFASLDPRTAGQLAATVGAYVRSRQAAAVIATHDMEQATEHASSIVVLAGRPATVAASFRVPPAAEPAARAALQATLRQRFAFLASEEQPPASSPEQRLSDPPAKGYA